MSTYVIGDIHGCLASLQALLDRIAFDPRRDRLWLVGDLVNGGPDSLGVLRWARRHRECIRCVVGNHDLYTLGRHAGVVDKKKRDTVGALLKADDADELLGWLRRRPLIHHEGGALMVHAGLAPGWSVAKAEELARLVEGELRDGGGPDFLRAYFRSPKTGWRKGLRGRQRAVAALQVFTMIRTCRPSGRLCFEFSGPPEEAPAKCLPWYRLRPRPDEPTFYFGHWAALGYRALEGAFGLDSGCVWGGQLTAFRMEDHQVFQVNSREL